MRSKMTTFASAATPIVRIMPAMPGSVIVIGYRRISAVEERREDQQRDVGDEAEEPVEEQHVDHHDEQADDAREQALAQRFLAERRRDQARARAA